jgi:BASS family bile acid:Na+ symporter
MLVSALQHAIHRYFIWIVIASYVVAGLFPGLGLSIRSAGLGEVEIAGARISLSAPSALLALLLFNAGLGTRAHELRKLAHQPRLLLVGVAGNVIVPLFCILAVSVSMSVWHNPEEVQQILTGLALVAAMPIAGASSAWAQNANGNLALSLGLILSTTLVSPLLTPVVLHAAGHVTVGDYSEDLHELASGGAGAFLGTWVILPSILGLAAHAVLGERRTASATPYVKLVNSAIIVTLNYSNAALSLPGVVSHPDLDFLAAILIIVGLLCSAMFVAGYLLSRIFRADRASAASLMFGLGMNNNGAGLVLASIAFSDHPRVMLPIIIYNLLQHLVASVVDKGLSRGDGDECARPASPETAAPFSTKLDKIRAWPTRAREEREESAH